MPPSQRSQEVMILVRDYYKTKDSSLVKDISDHDLDDAIIDYEPYQKGHNDLKVTARLNRLKAERKEKKDESKFWANLVKSNIVKYIFIGLVTFFGWFFGWFQWLFDLLT